MGQPAISGLMPGARIGPYRLLHRIGKGGFAHVWAAVEEGPHGFSKRVALKILHRTRTETDKAWTTLVNEARLGGQLSHPNVVDIYRMAEHDGIWVIAMELVEGRDLGVLLKDLRDAGLSLPPSVVADVGLQIARALEYAHTACDLDDNPLELVHRDLKPANVLLSANGAVKVADFGIAKATTNMDSTTAGQLKGTPYYMAPEVWAGEREFLPRVDLFSLGVMLWEMTMGERLFTGETPGAMAAQALFGDAEVESDRLAESFPSITALVRGLLERDPERRTQSATEVVQQLRALVANTEAPGDLSMFLQLVDVGLTPPTERDPHESERLELPETLDGSWSQLYALVRGESLIGADTRDFPAEQVASRGGGRLIQLRSAAGSRWATPGGVPVLGDTDSISALRDAPEFPSAPQEAPEAASATMTPPRVSIEGGRRVGRGLGAGAAAVSVVLVLALVGPGLAPSDELRAPVPAETITTWVSAPPPSAAVADLTEETMPAPEGLPAGPAAALGSNVQPGAEVPREPAPVAEPRGVAEPAPTPETRVAADVGHAPGGCPGMAMYTTPVASGPQGWCGRSCTQLVACVRPRAVLAVACDGHWA